MSAFFRHGEGLMELDSMMSVMLFVMGFGLLMLCFLWWGSRCSFGAFAMLWVGKKDRSIRLKL